MKVVILPKDKDDVVALMPSVDFRKPGSDIWKLQDMREVAGQNQFAGLAGLGSLQASQQQQQANQIFGQQQFNPGNHQVQQQQGSLLGSMAPRNWPFGGLF